MEEKKQIGLAPRSPKGVVGVIGSRSLPVGNAEQVGAVVEDLLKRKFHIASGGAVGTDEYCLAYLVHVGEADKGTLYSPWSTYEGFPVKVRALTRQFKEYGGSIIWGGLQGKEEYAIVRTGLLQRNLRLIEAVSGIVAFLYGESRGTLFTIRKALAEHLPVVIFCIDTALPEFKNIKWKPLKCGGCWENAYKAVYLK
ncbi:MAG: DNA-processing protein DprA [Candidatus Margulisbacteria bacterium]|nr:DNA-processing protein DprA [Candidatus Margulisiibacteriota bacterium]